MIETKHRIMAKIDSRTALKIANDRKRGGDRC